MATNDSTPSNEIDAKSHINGWIIQCIAPGLIMILVGSLVGFLIEVFYNDIYDFRLLYIFSLFVFAAVLIARISIDEGRAYATLFAIPLGLATWLVAATFVEVQGPLRFISPLLVLAFILIVWFWADRLTWDCTLVDFSKDVSNQGLIESVADRLRNADNDADLDSDSANPTTNAPIAPANDLAAQRADQASGPSAPIGDAARPFQQPAANRFGHSLENETTLARFGLDAQGNPVRPEALGEPLYGTTSRNKTDLDKWWSRFGIGKRKRNSPGIWVIYFSIAAIPIFGLGQAFVSPADSSSRRYIFILFLLYTMAGLGLLLTTSLLSLQRYLRKRNLNLPNPIALTWVATGGAAIIAILTVVWMLPRPAPEYSLIPNLVQLEASDRVKPSRYGMGNDGEHEASGGSPQSNSDSEMATSSSNSDRQGGSRGSGDSDQGQGDQDSQSDAGSSSDSSQSSSNSNGQDSSQSDGGSSDSQDDSQSDSQQSGDQGDSSNDSSNDPPNDNSDDQGSSDDRSQSSDSSGSGNQNQGRNSNQNDQSNQGEDTNGRQSGNESQSNGNRSQSGGGGSQQRNNDSNSNNGRENERDDESQNRSGRGGSGNESSSTMSEIGQAGLGALATVIKYGMILLLLIAAIIIGWKYREQIRESFSKWIEELKQLWARLFGGKKPKPKNAPDNQPSAIRSKPLEPFTAFRDPFESEAWTRWAPTDLVAYTFAAFEAWGRDLKCPRAADETPGEYAAQVAAFDQDVGKVAKPMAELYAQFAYADAASGQVSPDLMRRFWKTLKERYYPTLSSTPHQTS